MNRIKVLVLFGGESSEHDVSIMSARNVYAAMDTNKYDVQLVYIDQKGKWWLLESWQENLKDHAGVQLVAVPGASSFMTLPDNKIVSADIIFPVMHGENGHEDGAVQGMMQFLHIPVIGSGIAASALCWDKLRTKRLLEASGVAVTPYSIYRKGQELPEYDQLVKRLGSVMFVKPVTAGSSIGVSRVALAHELEPAITKALQYAETVLIEKAIVGRELEVAVLGSPPHHQVSGVGEIIPGEEFYSYEDKYAQNSQAEVVVGADISGELRNELRSTAHTAFAVLGCKGLARVDFLVDESGVVYVNELNTLPGFTNISQYPKLWQESGISYEQLIDELVADALG